MATSQRKIEFGDFQTSSKLANTICEKIKSRREDFGSILEPNCGLGSFLEAAVNCFPNCRSVLGYDINEDYVKHARRTINTVYQDRVDIKKGDFFSTDWKEVITELETPVLVVGNPPWVTNSKIGSINGSNLPSKGEYGNTRGFDSLLGKSNFDISLWMIMKLLDALNSSEGTLAMLCKTSTARKAMLHAWRNNLDVKYAAIYSIDAKKHFNANVSACLFLVEFGKDQSSNLLDVFDKLENNLPASTSKYEDQRIIKDVERYRSTEYLNNSILASPFKWRSGIKHDAAKVLELTVRNGVMYNGFDEIVEIEDEYIYPLKKGSDLARGKTENRDRRVIVTQKRIGEDTSTIHDRAPKTWEYLVSHSQILDKRKSRVYLSKPRFSVFGVGDYAFAPWKIAISSLYKSLYFRLVGPLLSKPVFFDDTVYYLPFASEDEAKRVFAALTSKKAADFLESQIFWDEMRPITVNLLQRLNIQRLMEAALEER